MQNPWERLGMAMGSGCRSAFLGRPRVWTARHTHLRHGTRRPRRTDALKTSRQAIGLLRIVVCSTRPIDPISVLSFVLHLRPVFSRVLTVCLPVNEFGTSHQLPPGKADPLSRLDRGFEAVVLQKG